MKNLSTESIAKLRKRRGHIPAAPKSAALLADGTLTPQAREDVQRCVDEIFRRNRTVGGTMALVVKGQVAGIFPYGLARVQGNVPVTENTYFRIASVSKLAFAFAALRLCEDGLLELDADISDYLGYRVRNPRFPDVPITLRQLLTHTASLVDNALYDGPGIDGEMSMKELLTPPNDAVDFSQDEPGTVFSYSNFGAGIVGSIMEIVTGERFDDLMQRLLFEPLSISASYATQRIRPVEDFACGYYVSRVFPPRMAYDAPILAARPLPAVNPEMDFTWSPGRLIIRAGDMAKLLRLLLSDGEIDGARILRPETLTLMRTCQDGLGSVRRAGRGLNVAVLEELCGKGRIIGHQGVAYGMNAELWGDVERGSGLVMQTSGTMLHKYDGFIRCGFEMTSFAFDLIDRLL